MQLTQAQFIRRAPTEQEILQAKEQEEGMVDSDTLECLTNAGSAAEEESQGS